MYLVSDVEDVIAKKCEDGLFDDVDIRILEEQDGCRITIQEIGIYIPDVDFYVYQGMMESWDASMQEYMTDCSLSVVLHKSTDVSYLYYENGSFVSALANYLHKSVVDIGQLLCEILTPEN